MLKENSFLLIPRLITKENMNKENMTPRVTKPMLFVRFGEVGFDSKVETQSLAGLVHPPWLELDTSNTISIGDSSLTT